MFSSTSFLVVVSLLASSAFSATVPSSTKNTTGPILIVADPDMDWSNGTLWYPDGSVAVQTKQVGKEMTFYEKGDVVSRLPIPKKPCANEVIGLDSNHVAWTLFKDGQFGLYAWGFRRPDGTGFVWRPYSDSSDGVNSVGGIVSLDTDPTKHHNGEIEDLARPAGFPRDLVPGNRSLWTIDIRGPADSKVTPNSIEMVELTYLLAHRKEKCGKRTD